MTVSYAQLREARPHKWQEAADEWESLAHYALTKDLKGETHHARGRHERDAGRRDQGGAEGDQNIRIVHHPDWY